MATRSRRRRTPVRCRTPRRAPSPRGPGRAGARRRVRLPERHRPDLAGVDLQHLVAEPVGHRHRLLHQRGPLLEARRVVELVGQREHHPAPHLAVGVRQAGQGAAQRGDHLVVRGAVVRRLPQRAHGHRRGGRRQPLDVAELVGDRDRPLHGEVQGIPGGPPAVRVGERHQQVVAVGRRCGRVLLLGVEGGLEQLGDLAVRVHPAGGLRGGAGRTPGLSGVRRPCGQPVPRGLALPPGWARSASATRACIRARRVGPRPPYSSSRTRAWPNR